MHWLRQLWSRLSGVPPINRALDDRPAPLLKVYKVAVSLHLRYRDGADLVTERIVDVQKFGLLNGRLLLFGHCRLRNARRSFRGERILQAIDLETGELIPEVGAYLNRRYAASPYRARDRLLTDHADA